MKRLPVLKTSPTAAKLEPVMGHDCCCYVARIIIISIPQMQMHMQMTGITGSSLTQGACSRRLPAGDRTSLWQHAGAVQCLRQPHVWPITQPSGGGA